MLSTVQLPKWAKLLFEPYRFKTVYGGRGGSKSWAFSDALIMRAGSSCERILCARETQKSIKDSSKKLIDDRIEAHGLTDQFDSTLTSIVNKKTGSEFIFSGLKDSAASLKSAEGITIAWVEEANTVSQQSIDTLIPTIRAKDSEIWFSYNPRLVTDPVHNMFVVNEPPPNSIVKKVNFPDNPWFPDVLREQMEWDRKNNPDKYNHLYGAVTLCIHSDAQVFYGRWRIDSVPEPPKDAVMYFGADWGFANDPTVLTRCWIADRTLYIDRAVGGVGIEIDKLPELFDQIEGSRKWRIEADSARPETISYMKNRGFQVFPAPKGKGSVEDGIEFMKSFDIVVDPKLTDVIDEFLLYSYKVDKLTDQITPVIVDANNHYIDSTRYPRLPE